MFMGKSSVNGEMFSVMFDCPRVYLCVLPGEHSYMHYISPDIHVSIYIYTHTNVYINMLAYTVYTYHTVLHTYALRSMFTDILLHLNDVANRHIII